MAALRLQEIVKCFGTHTWEVGIVPLLLMIKGSWQNLQWCNEITKIWMVLWDYKGCEGLLQWYSDWCSEITKMWRLLAMVLWMALWDYKDVKGVWRIVFQRCWYLLGCCPVILNVVGSCTHGWSLQEGCFGCFWVLFFDLAIWFWMWVLNTNSLRRLDF
jgi:hypothetical protein